MPTVSLDVTRSGWGGDIRKIEGAIISLQEYLFWILQVLDSGNVKFLNTNRTVIRSEDRTTHIDGSQLRMLDVDKNARLVMGYNSETGKYEFTMYNDSGAATITLDNNGNAVFSGKITASEIEGGTITGASITGASITGGSITSNTMINVGTDATIGESLNLKDGNGIGGTLSIYDGTSPTVLLRGEGSRPIRISTDSSIELSANAGIFDGNGNKVICEGYSGMYVTVNGTNYPVNFT